MQPPENWNSRNEVVYIPAGDVTLEGELVIPELAQGIVLFVHEGNYVRKSLRNQFLTERLRRGKVGSLLVDLLTPQESNLNQEEKALRITVPLLARRISGVTDWISRHPATIHLRIGYFALGIGSAAALVAASAMPATVRAIVSYGGRPDLAGDVLSEVRAPVLLMAGDLDPDGQGAAQQAFSALVTEKRLEIIPGAGPFFDEAQKLESIAVQANWWFERFIAPF